MIGRHLRIWLLAAFCSLPLVIPATLQAQAIDALRADQQARLDALAAQYGAETKGMDRSSDAYREVLKRYAAHKAAIETEMLARDPRGAELDALLSDGKGEIVNTGSRPKNVGADVDLAARSDDAAYAVVEKWRAQFGDANIEVHPHKFVNLATDTTLWLPESPDKPERLAAKLRDADAFYPEGGRKATGNIDAVRNDVGWALANKQKFLHAHAHGGQSDDLKTMGKSLSKLADGNEAYLKGTQSIALDPAANAQVVDQARILRNYGDVYQAGIADLGDPPDVVQQKVEAWKAQARETFAAHEQISLRRAQFQEKVQLSLAESVADTDTRQRIMDRLQRSRDSNAAILGPIDDLRQAIGLTGTESDLVRASNEAIAAHVKAPADPLTARPPQSLAEVERPVQIVSDEAVAALGKEPGKLASAYGLYDKATLAFNPVGALTELSAKIPGAPQPSSLAPGAGYLMTAVNLAVNYSRVWDEAEKGENAVIGFETEDTLATRRLKAAAGALLETSGAPGFMRDLGEAFAKEVDQKGDGAITADALVMTSARVVAASANAAIFKPVSDTLEAGKEGAKLLSDVWKNQSAHAARDVQRSMLAASQQDFLARSRIFDLGAMRLYQGGPGDVLLSGSVPDGSQISVVAERGAHWDDRYRLEWSITKDDKQVAFAPRKVTSAADPLAGVYQVMVSSWPAGAYEVRLYVRGTEDGKIHARRVEGFEVGTDPGQVKIGRVVISKFDSFDGPDIDVPVKPGRIVAFAVARVGEWSDQYSVDWFVNGVTKKEVKANDPKAHLIRFYTDGLSGPGFEMGVRLLDAKGKIVDYKSWKVPLEQAAPADLGPLAIQGALDDYGGAPLSGPVRNGAILAFSSDISFPVVEGSPPISEILWQVTGPDGRPVPGLAKREQVTLAGETKRFGFKFRPDRLANGAYRVEALHVMQGAARQETRGQAGFEISQPVFIRSVTITDRPNGEPVALMPEHAPHLYTHYALAAGVTGVQADMSVVSNGKTIYQTSAERPLKGDPAQQRVGVRLDPGLVSGKAEFRIALTTPQGERVEFGQPFTVGSYTAEISMSRYLEHDEDASYRLTLPPQFEDPIRVLILDVHNLRPGSGGWGRTGSLIGSNYDYETVSASSFILLEITDAKGRKALAEYFGEVAPPRPEPKPVAPPPPAIASYRPVQPAPAAPAPANKGVDLSDALNTFNQQMAQIQQNYNTNMQKIEERQNQYQQKMQQIMQNPTNPYAVASSQQGGGQSGQGAGSKRFGPHVSPMPCFLTLVMVQLEGDRVVSDKGYHNYAETRRGCAGSNWQKYKRESYNLCGVSVSLIADRPNPLQHTVNLARERGSLRINGISVVNGDQGTRDSGKRLGVCPF